MDQPDYAERIEHAAVERIARIETALAALTEEMQALRLETGTLRESLGRATQRPPISWPAVISSGVAVALLVGALYAAAVRPLDLRVERAERLLDERTVLLQDLKNTQVQVLSRLSAHDEDIRMIRDEGAPITQVRLAIIERELKITPPSRR